MLLCSKTVFLYAYTCFIFPSAALLKVLPFSKCISYKLRKTYNFVLEKKGNKKINYFEEIIRHDYFPPRVNPSMGFRVPFHKDGITERKHLLRNQCSECLSL